MTAGEAASPFITKGEMYVYLAKHGNATKDGVFVIRSGTLSQAEKDGAVWGDTARWLKFEEYAPGRLKDANGERYEYALAYFDPLDITGSPYRYLAIEGRLDAHTFVDQKLSLVKAGEIEEALTLLYWTALRLKANPQDKIIYQFNPAASGEPSKALKDAEDLIEGIKTGVYEFLGGGSGNAQKNTLIQWLANSGQLELRDAAKEFRVPQNVFAEGPGLTTDALPMTAIDALLPIAKQYWLDAGASPTMLDAANFAIADLPTGFAAWTEGQTITLDATGAGWGWFVDGTPLDYSEFAQADSASAWHVDTTLDADSPAAGHLDLLTVLIHELGHIVSLPSTATANDVMSQYLAPGQRRLLSGADVTALQAAGTPYFLTLLGAQTVTTGLGSDNIRYSALVAGNALDQVQATLSDPGFTGQAGWQTQGDVAIAAGTATLKETASAQTRLNQAFVLAPNDRFLSFTLSGIALDDVSNAPDDAFEAALIDANTGLSLLGGTGLTHNDA
ncbi:MAG: hypothetical protein L6Q40_01430, partial [Azonexus sp.]|nr:hypothetical protein [Azonexus sp.]